MADPIYAAADLMAQRLRLMKKTQDQARDRHDEVVELHVDEIFEEGDAAALRTYEEAMEQVMGREIPLLPEAI
nr:hypothetical protein [uncultured Holophaga sp.]